MKICHKKTVIVRDITIEVALANCNFYRADSSICSEKVRDLFLNKEGEIEFELVSFEGRSLQ